MNFREWLDEANIFGKEIKPKMRRQYGTIKLHPLPKGFIKSSTVVPQNLQGNEDPTADEEDNQLNPIPKAIPIPINSAKQRINHLTMVIRGLAQPENEQEEQLLADIQRYVQYGKQLKRKFKYPIQDKFKLR